MRKIVLLLLVLAIVSVAMLSSGCCGCCDAFVQGFNEGLEQGYGSSYQGSLPADNTQATGGDAVSP